VRLTNNPDDDYNADLSPDGQQIAFVSYGNGESAVYRIRIDGSERTRITTDVMVDGKVAWSPNGHQLAFGSYIDNAHGGLYTINTDGTGLQPLTMAGAYNGGISWRP
jgi:TolB protein